MNRIGGARAFDVAVCGQVMPAPASAPGTFAAWRAFVTASVAQFPSAILAARWVTVFGAGPSRVMTLCAWPSSSSRATSTPVRGSGVSPSRSTAWRGGSHLCLVGGVDGGPAGALEHDEEAVLGGLEDACVLKPLQQCRAHPSGAWGSGSWPNSPARRDRQRVQEDRVGDRLGILDGDVGRPEGSIGFGGVGEAGQ